MNITINVFQDISRSVIACLVLVGLNLSSKPHLGTRPTGKGLEQGCGKWARAWDNAPIKGVMTHVVKLSFSPHVCLKTCFDR